MFGSYVRRIGCMFRIRFLIIVALMALVGCVSPVRATEAPGAVTPTAEQLAPSVVATSTSMPTSTPEPIPTLALTHEEDLSGKAFILRDLDPDFKELFNSDYPA